MFPLHMKIPEYATTTRMMKTLATGLLLFSSFFWVWALKNTISMDPPKWDYGLVSFMTVMLTSSYLLAFANNNNATRQPGKLIRFLMTSSCLLVALNYALGTYIGYAVLDRNGFALYCLLFTILWFGIAFVASKIMKDSSLSPSSAGESQNLV